MLRRAFCAVPISLVGVLLGIGCASVAAYVLLRPAPAADAEHARALRFLAARASEVAGASVADHGDIDGDGVVDCWHTTRRAEPGITERQLTVWRGCAEPAVTFTTSSGRMTVLEIPEALGTRAWVTWIARQFVGAAHVSCAGAMSDCAQPDPAWRWVLAASADDELVPPRWQSLADLPAATARALIVPWAPRTWSIDWAERLPSDGARILVDMPGDQPTDVPAPVTCGGFDVRAAPSGLIAIDRAQARWTWLFHGGPNSSAFVAKRLRCEDGVALATTGGNAGDVVAVEPISGGYVLSRGASIACHWHWEGACATASLHPSRDGGLLRIRGAVVRIATLREWLATSRRPDIGWIAEAVRPELRDASARAAAGDVGDTAAPLVAPPVPTADIAAHARDGLTPQGSCAGWNVFASSTAILVERGSVARWLIVEPTRSIARLDPPRCDGGRLLVPETSVGDVLSLENRYERPLFVIDLSHRRPRATRVP